MFTGNPHQDQRGLDRRGHKSFTSGWKSGWSDFKNNRDLQGPMNPGGQLPRPNPWNGKPFPKGQETIMNPMNSIGDQASYVPSERVYPRFVIDDLLKQGVTVPNEIKQIGPDSWQITPRGMTPSPLRPKEYYTMNEPHGYSDDNFYNPNDDEYYDDYSDMYKDNPMRDDYYVQDPFSDIWGNQGGPLSFS